MEEGGVRREERSDVGNVVEALVQPLDDVGDEVGVRDRGADLTEGVGHRILELEVLCDGAVLLHDAAEFLGEVNLVGLLVVGEEGLNRGPDRVRSRGGGVGGDGGGHDEVDDLHVHGAV